MTQYTQILDIFGAVRVDQVLRDDGAFVLTGRMPGVDGAVDVPDFADPDGLAYRAWAEAGGKLGDPAPAAKPRLATTYQLMSALTDAQRAAYPGPIKAWDQRLFSARDTPWPEGNEKIGRIANALGTNPKAWFDAALSAG